jgi:hypothetical protein
MKRVPRFGRCRATQAASFAKRRGTASEAVDRRDSGCPPKGNLLPGFQLWWRTAPHPATASKWANRTCGRRPSVYYREFPAQQARLYRAMTVSACNRRSRDEAPTYTVRPPTAVIQRPPDQYSSERRDTGTFTFAVSPGCRETRSNAARTLCSPARIVLPCRIPRGLLVALISFPSRLKDAVAPRTCKLIMQDPAAGASSVPVHWWADPAGNALPLDRVKFNYASTCVSPVAGSVRKSPGCTS